MLELTVGNTDVADVRLTASSGFPLKGRILREGPPLQGIPSNDRGISLTSKISLMPGDSAAISSDDTFVFQNVLPGDYQIAGPLIFSGHLNEGHIKSVRLSGQELTTDSIQIRSRPEGELTIVISTETGKLQGRVVNGRREPASNATIVVVPEPSLRHRTNLFFEPKPDAAGKFSIDVPPGSYKVFAWEDVEPNAWFDADFMQTYESRGHVVAIGAGNMETVEVDVIPYMPQ